MSEANLFETACVTCLFYAHARPVRVKVQTFTREKSRLRTKSDVIELLEMNEPRSGNGSEVYPGIGCLRTNELVNGMSWTRMLLHKIPIQSPSR